MIVSFFDVISIGAVLPFITVITNPSALLESGVIASYASVIGVQNSSQLLLLATLFFGISAILAGVMRTLLLWVTTKFSFETCTELSSDIYLRTLFQPYQVHMGRNSSKVISGVLGQINTVIYDIILPLMILIGSMIISIIILIALIAFDPLLAPLLFVAFGLIYWLISFVTRKIMLTNSIIQAKESTKLIKTVHIY